MAQRRIGAGATAADADDRLIGPTPRHTQPTAAATRDGMDFDGLLFTVNAPLRKFATGHGTAAVAKELAAAMRALEAVAGAVGLPEAERHDESRTTRRSPRA